MKLHAVGTLDKNKLCDAETKTTPPTGLSATSQRVPINHTKTYQDKFPQITPAAFPGISNASWFITFIDIILPFFLIYLRKISALSFWINEIIINLTLQPVKCVLQHVNTGRCHTPVDLTCNLIFTLRMKTQNVRPIKSVSQTLGITAQSNDPTEKVNALHDSPVVQ